MIQGRIVIDSARCKGCDLCASVCPHQLIGRSTDFNSRGYQPALLADPHGDCTGCGVCALICPDVAITVYRQVARVAHAEAAAITPAGDRGMALDASERGPV